MPWVMLSIFHLSKLFQTNLSTSGMMGKKLQDSVSNPLLEFNSSQYIWAGNHFVPPEGVPTFSPSNFASYFKGRNTLFIGDSTGRRAYGTLFGMINSTDQSDVQVSELDHRDVIDFNKGGNHREEHCLIPGRTLMNNNSALLVKDSMVCRNIYVSNPASSTQNNNTNDNSAAAHNNASRPVENSVVNDNDSNSGKFDFFRTDCLNGLSPFVLNQTEKNMIGAESLKDYDLIVISMGIWEGARPKDCIMKNEAGQKLSNEDKFDLILDGLVNLSSPDLQIAFRTPGYSLTGGNKRVMDALKDHALNHPVRQPDTIGVAREMQTETRSNVTAHASNFTVVDWGSVISKRSFGGKRIHGDLKVHYGLEARQLFAQQLLHELLASSSSN